MSLTPYKTLTNQDNTDKNNADGKFICPACLREPLETVFVRVSDGSVLGCDRCAEIKEPCEMVRK